MLEGEQNHHQPRILYPVKISLKNEGKLKIFPIQTKAERFIARRIVLQEILQKNSLSRNINDARQKFVNMRINIEEFFCFFIFSKDICF